MQAPGVLAHQGLPRTKWFQAVHVSTTLYVGESHLRHVKQCRVLLLLLLLFPALSQNAPVVQAINGFGA